MSSTSSSSASAQTASASNVFFTPLSTSINLTSVPVPPAAKRAVIDSTSTTLNERTYRGGPTCRALLHRVIYGSYDAKPASFLVIHLELRNCRSVKALNANITFTSITSNRSPPRIIAWAPHRLDAASTSVNESKTTSAEASGGPPPAVSNGRIAIGRQTISSMTKLKSSFIHIWRDACTDWFDGQSLIVQVQEDRAQKTGIASFWPIAVILDHDSQPFGLKIEIAVKRRWPDPLFSWRSRANDLDNFGVLDGKNDICGGSKYDDTLRTYSSTGAAQDMRDMDETTWRQVIWYNPGYVAKHEPFVAVV